MASKLPELAWTTWLRASPCNRWRGPQVAPCAAEMFDMRGSDVVLAREQHRAVTVGRPAAVVLRDCGVCGSVMEPPRDQTLVIRDVSTVLRQLHLCSTCRSWVSEVVSVAS